MHFGKAYPNTVKNWLPFPFTVTNGAIRKMKLKQVGALHSGTVATLWFGVTQVSEEAEYWPDDPLWTLYTFVNSSDSLATIDIRVKLEEVLPHPGFGEFYAYRIHYEPRYDGALLGHRDVRPDLTVFPGSVGVNTQVGPSWLDPTNLSMWNQISFQCGAATWADQPEFQPYRTRP